MWLVPCCYCHIIISNVLDSFPQVNGKVRKYKLDCDWQCSLSASHKVSYKVDRKLQPEGQQPGRWLLLSVEGNEGVAWDVSRVGEGAQQEQCWSGIGCLRDGARVQCMSGRVHAPDRRDLVEQLNTFPIGFPIENFPKAKPVGKPAESQKLLPLPVVFLPISSHSVWSV